MLHSGALGSDAPQSPSPNEPEVVERSWIAMAQDSSEGGGATTSQPGMLRSAVSVPTAPCFSSSAIDFFRLVNAEVQQKADAIIAQVQSEHLQGGISTSDHASSHVLPEELPIPGALVSLHAPSGELAVLLRQHLDGSWAALGLDGCARQVRQVDFMFEQPFFDNTDFLEGLTMEDVDQLAAAMVANPGPFVSLIRETVRAVGGPLAPDLPDASMQLRFFPLRGWGDGHSVS